MTKPSAIFTLLGLLLIALPTQAQAPLFEALPSNRSNILNPSPGIRSVTPVALKNTNLFDFSVSLDHKQELRALSTKTRSVRNPLSSSNSQGIEIISGELISGEENKGRYTATVATKNGQSAIQILFVLKNGKHYALGPDTDGIYTLIEENHQTKPGCGHEHKEASVWPELNQFLPRSNSTTAANLDVLVLYSPEATTAVGGELAMAALAQQAINLSNQSYINSGVSLRLTLVHAAETLQSESGNYRTDLGRLQAQDDGYFDEAHSLRDEKGADVVVFLNAPSSYCGLGFAPNTPSSLYSGSLAFSIVSTSCINYYSFQHEIGHNLGLQHDVDNAPIKVAFEGSMGSRWLGDSGTTFRSVMAYSPGTRVPYFSNPEITYDGQATGSNGVTQNAFTLARVGPIAANYRASISEPKEQEENETTPSIKAPKVITPKNAKLDSLEVTTIVRRKFIELSFVALSADGEPIEDLKISIDRRTRKGTRSLGNFFTNQSGELVFKTRSGKRAARTLRKLLVTAISDSGEALLPSITPKNRKR